MLYPITYLLASSCTVPNVTMPPELRFGRTSGFAVGRGRHYVCLLPLLNMHPLPSSKGGTLNVIATGRKSWISNSIASLVPRCQANSSSFFLLARSNTALVLLGGEDRKTKVSNLLRWQRMLGYSLLTASDYLREQVSECYHQSI